MTAHLGRIGIWTHHSTLTPQLAIEGERLGYGAIWAGGSPSGDLGFVDEALAATDSLVIATGIVNIWQDDPATVAASHRRIVDRFPGRFLLGIGAGHREATQEYVKPYEALVAYLDGLDAAGVPADERVLAALGPRVLRLAAARTAGAHPYLTTPQHTREAREILGKGVLLVPEQKVVLETDAVRAREIARPTVEFYLGLQNYRANLLRLGFTEEDLEGEGSDRLIDALALHGDVDTVATGLREHLDAGADQVVIQVLGDDPSAGYRALAAALK
ncbi:LLM class F420-dependent oxidoreductase [Tsukamurella sp. 8F]|uniref:LLM class F420-dependent oxidoreductase n=1 Tax=unclassified Tsukamurella TaxID=2633480 RepID=UPI0023B9BE0A|nr:MULTISPECIES: LLM class F420-dependent oxidoreductase [unclassified Tsukamurella]MDF0528511.1 LLM class F420-dependent oxidoreductase [Tsukamurella sp. 8J]MDF0586337.1 LLM class F420-dependent oxidoreductase [Tsukamurella sp. 8F]